ncbi:MAG: hypothetical protein ABSF90_31235 [Syntrophobacteraceae bacterium]|jgi:hypothetical protein
MKKVLIVFLFAFLASIGTTHAASYEETVAKWTSYNSSLTVSKKLFCKFNNID